MQYDFGDLLLLCFPKTLEQGSTKLVLNYMGPFLVTKQTSSTTYFVLPLGPLPRYNKQQHVHVSRIKRYIPKLQNESPPSTETEMVHTQPSTSAVEHPQPGPSTKALQPKSCLNKSSPLPPPQSTGILDLSPDTAEPTKLVCQTVLQRNQRSRFRKP